MVNVSYHTVFGKQNDSLCVSNLPVRNFYMYCFIILTNNPRFRNQKVIV